MEPPTCRGKGQDPAGNPETPEAEPFPFSKANTRAAKGLTCCKIPCELGHKDVHSVGGRLKVAVEFGDALCERGELHK